MDINIQLCFQALEKKFPSPIVRLVVLKIRFLIKNKWKSSRFVNKLMTAGHCSPVDSDFKDLFCHTVIRMTFVYETKGKLSDYIAALKAQFRPGYMQNGSIESSPFLLWVIL